MSLVKDFTENPSNEVLQRCTKDQLVAIAEHYSVQLTSSVKKKKDTLFEAVETTLVKQKILGLPALPLSASEGSPEFKLGGEVPSHFTRTITERDLDKELRIKWLQVERELGLKRLEQEAIENEKQREFQHHRVRKEHEFQLKKLQLELSARQPTPPPASVPSPPNSVPQVLLSGDTVGSLPVSHQPEQSASQVPFDVTRNIRMVPPFSECDVDKYFAHFARVATTL